MKLVYADAVKAMIYENTPLKLFMKRTIEGAHHSMGVLRSMIDELPAVDAEPVKRGVFYRDDDRDEWYTYRNHCVSCGQTWMGSTNYCPNCGLKLKEVNILEEKDESGRRD